MIEHIVLEELHLFILNEEDTQRINNIEDQIDGEAMLFDTFVITLDTAILNVEWNGEGSLQITLDPKCRKSDNLTLLTNIRKYIEGEL